MDGIDVSPCFSLSQNKATTEPDVHFSIRHLYHHSCLVSCQLLCGLWGFCSHASSGQYCLPLTCLFMALITRQWTEQWTCSVLDLFSTLPATLLTLPNEYFCVCVWAIVPSLFNKSGNMNHSHTSPQLQLLTSAYSTIFDCCPRCLLARHFVCCYCRTRWEVSWRLLACVIQCWLL